MSRIFVESKGVYEECPHPEASIYNFKMGEQRSQCLDCGDYIEGKKSFPEVFEEDNIADDATPAEAKTLKNWDEI